jgi:hypothetical protein
MVGKVCGVAPEGVTAASKETKNKKKNKRGSRGAGSDSGATGATAAAAAAEVTGPAAGRALEALTPGCEVSMARELVALGERRLMRRMAQLEDALTKCVREEQVQVLQRQVDWLNAKCDGRGELLVKVSRQVDALEDERSSGKVALVTEQQQTDGQQQMQLQLMQLQEKMAKVEAAMQVQEAQEQVQVAAKAVQAAEAQQMVLEMNEAVEQLEEEVQGNGGLLHSMELLDQHVFRMDCLREEADGRAEERLKNLEALVEAQHLEIKTLKSDKKKMEDKERLMERRISSLEIRSAVDEVVYKQVIEDDHLDK